MHARAKKVDPPAVEPRVFRSIEEIDRGIAKLERRISNLEELDIAADMRGETGALEVVRSDIKEAIREVFGSQSPEFAEHEYISIWAGPQRIRMESGEVLQGKEQGRTRVMGILKGLVARLKERREELEGGSAQIPSTYFDRLNLHPRILDVSRDLFLNGHHWEAVFAGAKALVNMVKERSGSDLDGAALMRAVFSKNDPILAFNDLREQTDLDEQEGMMHLFEGAVLGIRNPGGHAFPEGPEQRAIEYIQLLSLLAYRTQEAKRLKRP